MPHFLSLFFSDYSHQQGTLPTQYQSKLLALYIYMANVFFFFFSRNCLKSKDHIFFECSFTRRILDDTMKLCLVSNAQLVLEDLIDWGARELKGKGLRVIACKLAWWATVYHIWLQRNAIVHEERIWTEEQLKRSIIMDVNARLRFKTKLKKSVLNSTICYNWGIDPSSILIWSLKSCAAVFCQSASLCAIVLKVLVMMPYRCFCLDC